LPRMAGRRPIGAFGLRASLVSGLVQVDLPELTAGTI
jgi:hypothetical protein